jgi:hypothetical protein
MHGSRLPRKEDERSAGTGSEPRWSSDELWAFFLFCFLVTSLARRAAVAGAWFFEAFSPGHHGPPPPLVSVSGPDVPRGAFSGWCLWRSNVSVWSFSSRLFQLSLFFFGCGLAGRFSRESEQHQPHTRGISGNTATLGPCSTLNRSARYREYAPLSLSPSLCSARIFRGEHMRHSAPDPAQIKPGTGPPPVRSLH